MPNLSYSSVPSGIMEMLSAERARIEQANQAAAQARALQAARISQLSQQAVQPPQMQQPQVQIQTDPAMMEFGEYKYNAELAPRLQDYTNRYNRLNQILQADEKQATFVKNNLDLLNKQFSSSIEPFEKTEQYKLAAEAAKSAEVTKESSFIDLLGKTIKSVESSPQEYQANAAKTFLTSLVNSAKGTADAEQANEFIRRAPELETYFQYAQDVNKSVFDPKTIASYLDSNPGKKLVKLFSDPAKPAEYLEKVKNIHDDKASTWNENVYNRIVRPTSPETAEKFGVVPKSTFRDIEQQAQVQRPSGPPPGTVRRIR
jgi:hypothetical protein